MRPILTLRAVAHYGRGACPFGFAARSPAVFAAPPDAPPAVESNVPAVEAAAQFDRLGTALSWQATRTVQ